MRCLILALSLTACASMTAAEPVVNVLALKDRTPAEVQKWLGKPTSEEKTKQGHKRTYKHGRVEIIFMGGKPGLTFVNGMCAITFDEHALAALGLQVRAPSFRNANVIRWENQKDSVTISVFPLLNGKVDYASIRLVAE